MLNYTMDQIRSICEASALPLGIPFIDDRLEEYHVKYSGRHTYYATLRDIVSALKPDVVLEIGTWEGTSAASFAAGCPDTAVLTIDHHSDPGDDANFAKSLEVMRVYPKVQLFHGCSTEKVTALKPGTECVLPAVQEFLAGRTIDILLIDGWHGGDFARADYDTYAPLMSPGALVICDDIHGGDSAAIFGMRAFWDDLPLLDKYLDGRIHAGYPMGFGRMP